MFSSTHPFLVSSVLLYNNAIKSILFGLASLLARTAVQSFFALWAARAGMFTAFLMFDQGWRQRGLFVRARGVLTHAGILVLAFSLMTLQSDFYGTALWALDCPGYALRRSAGILADLDRPLREERDYITILHATPDKLASLASNLAGRMTGNLIKPSINATLEGLVALGQPSVVSPTRSGTGARVWVDPGLSVSPDESYMLPFIYSESGKVIGATDCAPRALDIGGSRWNCTFNNTFALTQLQISTGNPEVHWDDASDPVDNNRYILPSRYDNIWTSYSQGVGTVLMKQVFTVTKSNRRHTFLETVIRATLYASPMAPLAAAEMDDFLRRTLNSSSDLPQRLLRDIGLAQARNQSFSCGVSFNSDLNLSASQVSWEYLTAQSNGLPLYSTLRFSNVGIKLMNSETLPAPRVPKPFNNQTCAARFMNIAYGGVVAGTDCQSGESAIPAIGGPSPSGTAASRFFGQVDTAAVLIVTGLGDGRSGSSAAALDQTVLDWVSAPAVDQRLNALLLARAYAVGGSPELVAVTLTEAMAAASGLQLTLVGVIAMVAAVGVVLLSKFAAEAWSHTLFWNLVVSLKGEELKASSKCWLWNLLLGGDSKRIPEMTLRDAPGHPPVVSMDGQAVVLAYKGNPVEVKPQG